MLAGWGLQDFRSVILLRIQGQVFLSTVKQRWCGLVSIQTIDSNLEVHPFSRKVILRYGYSNLLSSLSRHGAADVLQAESFD